MDNLDVSKTLQFLFKQVVVDVKRPRDPLRLTQSSSCCAQSWTLSVIDRRRSSVDRWQHLATIDVPSRNYS